MEKKSTYSIILDDIDKETIAKIKEITRMKDTSTVIRMALTVYYEKLEPLYIRTKSQQTKRTVYESPEDRVKAQIKKKQEDDEAKRAVEKERALQICSALDGEIIEQDNGALACKFSLYEKVGKRVLEGSRTVPFENLHESILDTQFKGADKETILTLLKEGRD